eukprot:jgi/Ulvmu1/3201/UM015_0242.1
MSYPIEWTVKSHHKSEPQRTVGDIILFSKLRSFCTPHSRLCCHKKLNDAMATRHAAYRSTTCGVTSLRPHSTRPKTLARTRAIGARPSGSSANVGNVMDCVVEPVQGGEPCKFEDAWQPTTTSISLLVFFTHWADLGSLELAQRLVEKLPQLETAGVAVLGVGLGSPAAGAKFSELSGFPASQLYADPASACHKMLGYSPGFLGDSNMNGYVKVFPMLAGIGSPGTMQEVIRGYIGDRNAEQIFPSDSVMGRAFGILGDGYQRPFELATVRLKNMVASLANWSELAPEDTQQLVQQGGSMLVKGKGEILFEHADSGILQITNVEKLMEVVQGATSAASGQDALNAETPT